MYELTNNLNLIEYRKPIESSLIFEYFEYDHGCPDSRQTDISYITCWSYNSTSSHKKSTLKVDLCYFHADPIGSASLITDDEGYLLQEYHYDAFGSIIFSRGSDGNRYRFAGKEYDQETGLSYFVARFYDPITGRFISRDPIFVGGDPQRHNRYTYCDNNPYKYIDPNGEIFWVAVAAAVIGGAYAGSDGFTDFDDFNWEKAFAGGAMAFTAVYSFGTAWSAGFSTVSSSLGIVGSTYGLVSTSVQIVNGEGLTMGAGLSALATFGFGELTGSTLKGMKGGKKLVGQLFTSLISTGISIGVRASADGTNPTVDDILRSFGMALGMSAITAGVAWAEEPATPQQAQATPNNDAKVKDKNNNVTTKKLSKHEEIKQRLKNSDNFKNKSQTELEKHIEIIKKVEKLNPGFKFDPNKGSSLATQLGSWEHMTQGEKIGIKIGGSATVMKITYQPNASGQDLNLDEFGFSTSTLVGGSGDISIYNPQNPPEFETHVGWRHLGIGVLWGKKGFSGLSFHLGLAIGAPFGLSGSFD